MWDRPEVDGLGFDASRQNLSERTDERFNKIKIFHLRVNVEQHVMRRGKCATRRLRLGHIHAPAQRDK